MKILVVSDTHGNYLAPFCCLDNIGDIDLIIHLGDEIEDARLLEKIVTIPVIMVPGNCDHGAKEQHDLCITIAGRRFLITHGDRYRVKKGVEELVRKAKSVDAALALYGHTHNASIQNLDGVLLVNPGTLMANSCNKSFALLTITDHDVSAEIREAGTIQQPQPQL